MVYMFSPFISSTAILGQSPPTVFDNTAMFTFVVIVKICPGEAHAQDENC